MATIILPCAKGCEAVLAEEAGQLGLINPKIGTATVKGEGDIDIAYRLCLWSRLASRVLWQIEQNKINSVDDLYQSVYQIDWSEHLAVNRSFKVDFNGQGQGINNSLFGALKVKDAIVDKLRAIYQKRPDVDSKNPDITIDAHLKKGVVTIAIDLSGNLTKRGYRIHQTGAPIRENIASLLLYRSLYHKNPINLIDPFCGSGTILLEALLIAGKIAPALNRLRFGFEHWQQHIPVKWQKIRQDALAIKKDNLSNQLPLLIGFDQDPKAIEFAQKNLTELGLANKIIFKQQSFSQFDFNQKWGDSGFIISNPPYGVRIGEDQNLAPIYQQIGEKFINFPNDWQMSLINSDEALLKQIKLVSSKQYQAFNGQMPCVIKKYIRANQFENNIPNFTPQKISSSAQMFANRLIKNWTKLQKKAEKAQTNAYRIYDQDLPEYAFAIDKYGDFIHLQEYAPPKEIDKVKAKQRFFAVMQVIPEVLAIPKENIIVKTREKQKGNNQYQKQNQLNRKIIIQENRAKFWVNLHDYLDTGVFLDHRPMRQKIYQIAKNKRFLNLFCYTATASVQAALGGALFTTSVDLSSTYLNWAKENFELNNLSNKHRLERADVLEWLLSGNSLFDVIFCDPPTFSNTKKTNRIFDVQNNHEKLIIRAMNRLAKGGVLYFSNNYSRFKLSSALYERFEISDISGRTIDFDFNRRQNIHKAYKIAHR